MSIVFNRILAAIWATLLLILSARILPLYWEQYLYHTVLLATAILLLAEGAWRRRLILCDPPIVIGAIGFVFAIACSFFGSDLDKRDVSAESLTRLLWFVSLAAAWLIAMHDPPARRVLAGVASVAVILWAVRSNPPLSPTEAWRIGFGAVVGLALAASLKLRKAGAPPPSAVSLAVASSIASAILTAGWAGWTMNRLRTDEVTLVERNLQADHALASVARRCLKEHPVTGAGPGSIDRKFLQYRPVHATLRGVPDRVPYPSQTMVVLAGEIGAMGLLFLMWLVSAACVIAWVRTPVSWDGALLLGLYGLFAAHEAAGGAWLLTHGAAMGFFVVMGLLTAPAAPRPGREFPASVFWTGLTLLGGFVILQQIFWQKTYEYERILARVQDHLRNGRLNEAADEVDYGLVWVDYRRNDLLSKLIGGLSSKGMVELALKNSVLLSQRDPDYPAVKNNIVVFNFMLRRFADAIPYMTDIVEKQPTTENFTRLGHLYAATGDTEKAQAVFQRALDLFPREVDVFLGRARRLPDSVPQGVTLLESAAFSVNHRLRRLQETRDAATFHRLADLYRSTSARLKQGVGIKGGQ